MRNGKIIDERGSNFWYKNDELHREDGPAVEAIPPTPNWEVDSSEDGPQLKCTNMGTVWYKNGKLHREDGPAVCGYDTPKGQNYFNGVIFDKKAADGDEWWYEGLWGKNRKWTDKELEDLKSQVSNN